MKIERLPVSDLKPYENNAKIHTPEQVQQIKKSIQDFGFNDPIAVDENNMVIEGHGRLLAVQELGWKEVDCIRLDGMTEDQKRAYIHIHNQLTMNTGFDLDILEQELKSIEGIDMAFFGFDMDFEIDSDFTFDDGENAAADVAAAAAAKEPRAKRGQIWQLGRHRLMIGDSTDAEDVEKLTGGEYMDLCVTDPPYNVALGQKDYNTNEARKRHRRIDGLVIMNDSMEDGEFYDFLLAFYEQMLHVLKPGGSYYIFHADSEGLNFRAALQGAGSQPRQVLVWVKNSMTLGRQDYQWKHEPILYGWKDGAGHYFVNDRCQTTVFESKMDPESMTREELVQLASFLLAKMETFGSVIHHDRPTRSELHPTMKPVALCAKLIQNSSKRGEKVIDFFGGSGSTLMACEETGRICYAMELDPKYADVILSRWEDATGERAVLLSGI
ncbi:MAG: site-specific DNA-methyltransferase [Faecousia sp.]